MHAGTKFGLVAACAATLLASLAAHAVARTGIATEPSAFSSSVGRLSFGEGGGGGVTVICDLTLTGSLHEFIPKNLGTLVGYITEYRTANCSNSLGVATTVTLLTPLHLTYEGFTGTLPDIDTVTLLIRQALLLRLGSFSECLYAENVRSTSNTGVATNGVTDLRIPTEAVSLFRRLGGIVNCPAALRLSAASTFRMAEPITVILVD